MAREFKARTANLTVKLVRFQNEPRHNRPEQQLKIHWFVKMGLDIILRKNEFQFNFK